MEESSPTPPPVASLAFENADIETVLHALKWMRIYEEANVVFGDDVVGKAENALTQLSARQAAFEAMRKALEGMIKYSCYKESWQDEHPEYVQEAKAALALADAEI